MAYKKPTVLEGKITSAGESNLDTLKSVLELLVPQINTYGNGILKAALYDTDSTTRTIDLLLSVTGCDYSWCYRFTNYSTNEILQSVIYVDNDTRTNMFGNSVITTVRLVASYLYNPSYHNVIYTIVSNESAFFNLVLCNTSSSAISTIALSNTYMFGITPTESNKYMMVTNTLMSGYIAGETVIRNATVPQVISQSPGSCVMRKVLYNNGETLSDVWLFNSYKGIASTKDWYVSLKNSGIYFCVGYSSAMSIFRINEDARNR